MLNGGCDSGLDAKVVRSAGGTGTECFEEHSGLNKSYGKGGESGQTQVTVLRAGAGPRSTEEVVFTERQQ